MFERVPGEGHWQSALWPTGTSASAATPWHCFTATGQLIGADGRVVIEVAGPGIAATTRWLAFECEEVRSRPFRWSVIGTDDIEAVALASGFSERDVHRLNDVRWCAVLVAVGSMDAKEFCPTGPNSGMDRPAMTASSTGKEPLGLSAIRLEMS